jgi:transcriptional regulator with XRE-family HTH domain
MKKNIIKQALLAEGYALNTITKYLQGNKKTAIPTLRKAIRLEKIYGIPCTAWADIKSFITDNNTKSKNGEQELPSVTEVKDGNE